MHPEDIKASVRKKGTTLTALATSNGLSPSACRKSLKVPCGRADVLIARCIGKPLHEIWPNRYDRKGKRRFTKVNNRRSQDKTHRLSTEAR
ncbi:MAG: helix-turn-helix domain-containing protein [Brevundimonas sp.]